MNIHCSKRQRSKHEWKTSLPSNICPVWKVDAMIHNMVVQLWTGKLLNPKEHVGWGENSRATKGVELVILIEIDESCLGIAQHRELMGLFLHTQVPFCKGCFAFCVILNELDGNLVLTHPTPSADVNESFTNLININLPSFWYCTRPLKINRAHIYKFSPQL